MREIKFRAWDKENKRMTPSFSLTTFSYAVFGVVDHQLYNYNIMQFTGLLDKNGKEIYEFDLLQFDWFYIGDSKEKGGIGIVKYEDDGFGLYRKDGDYIGTIFDMIKNNGAIVIGNIFENPDLLILN